MIFASTVRAARPCLFVLILMGCGGAGEKEAKQLIERTLVDPMSVQYREVKSYGDGTVCGEFNAKNRMGGYTGFGSFVYFRGKLWTSTKYVPVLCSNEKDKEGLIRRIDPSFTTTKDRDACMRAAKSGASKPVSGAADMRKEEVRLRDACAQVTEGF